MPPVETSWGRSNNFNLKTEQAAYSGTLSGADARNLWNSINSSSDIPADFSVLLSTMQAHWVNPVQKLYIAYYGRPADPAGLLYWVKSALTGGGNWADLTANFVISPESTQLYGNISNTDLVNAIYMNVFGRTVEQDGLAYWVEQLNSGSKTKADLALAVVNSAAGSDAITIANRLSGANTFTTELETSGRESDFFGATVANVAREWLSGIGADQADLTAALAVTTNLISNFTAGNVSGLATDGGYLVGATIFVDNNGNGRFDVGEQSTTTDSNGKFNLSNGSSTTSIIGTGGIDLGTGLAFTGTLKAPSGATSITPLTTLAQNFIEYGLADSVEATENLVFGELNLPRFDLSLYDPMKAGLYGSQTEMVSALQVQAITTQVMNLANAVSAMLTGVGANHEAAHKAVFQALAQQLNKGQTIDLGSSSNIQDTISQAASNAGLTSSQKVLVELGKHNISVVLSEINTRVQMAASGFADGRITSSISALSDMFKLQKLTQGVLSTHLSSSTPSNTTGSVLDTYTGDRLTNELDTVKAGSTDSVTPTNDGTTITNPDTGGGGNDLTAPILSSFTPLDNATGVAVSSNVVLTFSEAVKAVTGKNLVIHKTSDNGVVTTIDAASNQITISGGVVTVNPAVNMMNSTEYYVLIDAGAFKVAANNSFGGLTFTTAISFTTLAADDGGGGGDTTAPVFASAAVNGTTLVMTYTEASTLDATNTPVIGAFSVSGNTVTAVTLNAAAKTVTLTLGTAVLSTDTVTVGYTDPTAGNDVAAIQDAAGNDADTITLQPVTNNTGSTPFTTSSDALVGTVGDDTFTATYDAGVVTDTLSSGDSLNGIGGTDTLKINHFIDVAITPPDALWTNISGIEKVVLNTTGNGAQTITTGAFFEAAFGVGGVELATMTSGSGAINITMTTFTGAVTLSTTSLAGAQTIVVGSGATSVTATSGAGAMTIYGTGLATVTASTTGAGAQTIGDGIGGGANLATVTASSNSGAQIITSTSTSAVTVNATATAAPQTITTGTGNDLVTATSATGQLNTIVTNAGDDTIVAGLGTDLITGGSGADLISGGGGTDTFAFGSDGSVSGTSMDSITDFNAAEADILVFGISTILLPADASPLGAGANVQQSAGGLISFDASDNTLSLKTIAIQADLQLDAVGSICFFVDGVDTYIYYAGAATGNADDQIIKLIGITSLNTITVGSITTVA